MYKTLICHIRNHFSDFIQKRKDWLKLWRKKHKDELKDLDFKVIPSRECPDYCNNLFE